MKLVWTLVLVILSSIHLFGQSGEVKRVLANGAEFHYVEEGTGEPLILLHGGIGDYRSWEPQIHQFAKSFRVIAYSRRLYFPNQNQPTARPFSVYTEAADLAAFLNALKIKRVNLVGASIGGFVALVYAIHHPKVVHSLVLAEAPVHQLVRNEVGGEAVYQQFLDSTKPVVSAFNEGDDRQALRIFTRLMGRDFDTLPPAAIESTMQNIAGIRAVILASEPFPAISEQQLRKLRMPVLVITGENTILIHKLVNNELARLIPNAEKTTIPRAGHASNRENPEEFNQAVMSFLLDRSKGNN